MELPVSPGSLRRGTLLTQVAMLELSLAVERSLSGFAADCLRSAPLEVGQSIFFDS